MEFQRHYVGSSELTRAELETAAPVEIRAVTSFQ